MEEFWKHLWDVLGPFLGLHAWMAVPMVFLTVLGWKSPELLSASLEHRREMHKLRIAEQRRKEGVERRQRSAATKKAVTKKAAGKKS